MRKIATIVSILMIAIGFSAFAQDAAWYVNKPIDEIRFLGLKNIDESELSGITDQFINQNFTDTLFWDLQSKLYSLNYFDNFTANAVPVDETKESVIIEFTVTERPLIGEIVIRGNKSITKTKILEVVIVKVDDILNNSRIRMDEQAIKRLYIDEGYPDVKVESTVENSLDEGYIDITFKIDEGSQTRISTISFAGNSFASENTLKRQLELKQQSFFSKGIFQESLIEQDKIAIQKYYADAGFIDMQITDVVINEIENEDEGDDKNYIEIIFYIEENKQWNFGGFSFEGNTLFSDEELLAATASKPGSTLNKSLLEADFMKIGDMYYNDGYIYNNIRTEEIRDQQTNEISFSILIDEKNRAHIENIILSGNEKTKDHVILRELPIEVGDVFSKSLVMQGLNNLYNTQYFSSVVPEMPFGSQQGLMDLVINVEEQNTTDIQFGLTFTAESDSIPIIGFLKWNDSNFRGDGQSLSIGTEISPTTQELSFGFNDSWLFNERISGGIDFSISHDQYTSVPQDIMLPIFNIDDSSNPQVVPDPYDGHWVDAETGEAYSGTPSQTEIDNAEVLTDYDYAVENGESIADEYLMDYNSFTMSLSGSGGYTFMLPTGRLSLGSGLSTALSYLTYKPEIYRPFDKDVRDSLNALSLTNRTWLTASYDTRDLIYSPTKGFIVKETLTYVGGMLFGNRDYIKSTTDADAYLKLFDIPVSDSWNFSTVMGLHGQFSAIMPQWGYYDTDNDGIRDSWTTDTIITTSDLLYFDGMFTARGWGSNYDNKALLDIILDFTTPISPGMLSWNTFLSGTAVWEEPSDMLSMSLDDYYFSLGTGLQIDIPSFPISFFLVKRAKFNDGVLGFERGQYFTSDDMEDNSGLDFVITFDIDYF